MLPGNPEDIGIELRSAENEMAEAEAQWRKVRVLPKSKSDAAERKESAKKRLSEAKAAVAYFQDLLKRASEPGLEHHGMAAAVADTVTAGPGHGDADARVAETAAGVETGLASAGAPGGGTEANGVTRAEAAGSTAAIGAKALCGGDPAAIGAIGGVNNGTGRHGTDTHKPGPLEHPRSASSAPSLSTLSNLSDLDEHHDPIPGQSTAQAGKLGAPDLSPPSISPFSTLLSALPGLTAAASTSDVEAAKALVLDIYPFRLRATNDEYLEDPTTLPTVLHQNAGESKDHFHSRRDVYYGECMLAVLEKERDIISGHLVRLAPEAWIGNAELTPTIVHARLLALNQAKSDSLVLDQRIKTHKEGLKKAIDQLQHCGELEGWKAKRASLAEEIKQLEGKVLGRGLEPSVRLDTFNLLEGLQKEYDELASQMPKKAKAGKGGVKGKGSTGQKRKRVPTGDMMDDEVDGGDGDEDDHDGYDPAKGAQHARKHQWYDLSEEEQAKRQELGRKQIKKYLESGDTKHFSVGTRRLAREIAEFLPEAATTNRDLATLCFLSAQGNYICRYHGHSRWNKECDSAILLVGVGHPKSIGSPNPPPNHMHCGCSIDDVLLDFIFFKTLRISSTNPNLAQFPQGMLAETVPARIRSFMIELFKTWTGLTVDDLYTHEETWASADHTAAVRTAQIQALIRSMAAKGFQVAPGPEGHGIQFV
ncbi:hypothetical protein MD484_g4585, partial [Candolleomyces efflorescens]